MNSGKLTAATQKKFGNTGLSLAITKRFVELMHGRISVESEIDKGSVFTVAITLNESET